MHESNKKYISVWGDTVNLRELLIGMFLGAITGYVSFTGGIWFLQNYYLNLPKGLLMGYALLFGIIGCLIAGAVAAKTFRAKRIFIEDSSCLDMTAALRELNLNPGLEDEYLQSVPQDVKEEMKELQIYQLFSKEKDYKEQKE